MVVDSSSKSGAISPTARLAALEMRDCNFNGAKAVAVIATRASTIARRYIMAGESKRWEQV